MIFLQSLFVLVVLVGFFAGLVGPKEQDSPKKRGNQC